jgi:hypothetical protein
MPASDGVVELVPLPAVTIREREVQHALRKHHHQERPQSHSRQRTTIQRPRAGQPDDSSGVHPTSVKQPAGAVKRSLVALHPGLNPAERMREGGTDEEG